jgi:hypothetical protein
MPYTTKLLRFFSKKLLNIHILAQTRNAETAHFVYFGRLFSYSLLTMKSCEYLFSALRPSLMIDQRPLFGHLIDIINSEQVLRWLFFVVLSRNFLVQSALYHGNLSGIYLKSFPCVRKMIQRINSRKPWRRRPWKSVMIS